MIITLAQMGSVSGRIAENLEKIRKNIEEAPEGALVIFPELALTGGGLGELLDSEMLANDVRHALHILEEDSVINGKSAIIGTASARKQAELENVALLITQGKSVVVSSGGNDSVEESSGKFILGGETFTVILGSDMHNSVSRKAKHDARLSDFIIVMDIDHYNPDALKDRWKSIFNIKVGSESNRVIYVNASGAQDGQVFYGNSYVEIKNKIAVMLPYFEDSVESFDTKNYPKEDMSLPDINLVKMKYDAAVIGLREYVRNNGMTKVAVGASGGIDSALVLAIAADAIGGENVLGIAMPSQYSSDHSLTDAENLMTNIGGEYRVIPIKDMVAAFQSSLQLTGVAEENLQARVRGVVLMGVSNAEGHLILAPGNKSELAVGYSTIYGDAVGGYGPIKDLYKTEVYELSEYRNTLPDAPIPVSTMTKPPSAELSPGQLDTDSLPDYDVLDDFLEKFLELGHERYGGESISMSLSANFGGAMTEDILKKIQRSEWKRAQYPLGTQLSMHPLDLREVPLTR